MTGMQLRAEVFDDLNAILDDEGAMQKLRGYLSRLRKKAATPPAEKEAMTAEDKAEALNDIRSGLREWKLMKQGRLKSRPVEELLNEL